MKILAIETSCDETAVALVECSKSLPVPDVKVLGSALYSQIHVHKEYGGVYPMLAKREHERNLPALLDQTLAEAGASAEDVDIIAVTSGPGLEPALWAGIEFAKDLGKRWGKSVMPVNHMEGHLLSFLFEKRERVEFPAIALLVSGGHTELVLMEGFDKYRIVGETRDDAVGEAFDKTARLLGLPYPGGPKLSELAEISRRRGEATDFRFPSPMLDSGDLDFSYSGLKTAVLYQIKKLGELDMQTKEDLARAFEDAAIAPLMEKTREAALTHDAKSLIVGGGVSANKHLQSELTTLASELSLDLRLPRPELTGDNAVMIAIAAYVRLETGRAGARSEGEEIKALGRLGL